MSLAAPGNVTSVPPSPHLRSGSGSQGFSCCCKDSLGRWPAVRGQDPAASQRFPPEAPGPRQSIQDADVVLLIALFWEVKYGQRGRRGALCFSSSMTKYFKPTGKEKNITTTMATTQIQRIATFVFDFLTGNQHAIWPVLLQRSRPQRTPPFQLHVHLSGPFLPPHCEQVCTALSVPQKIWALLTHPVWSCARPSATCFFHAT